MTDKELIRTCKLFTKGILDGKPTTDMCYVVCSPLVAYLSCCGVESTLTEGELQGKYHHFWITLKDGRIIDPTADQFGLLNIWVILSIEAMFGCGSLPHIIIKIYKTIFTEPPFTYCDTTPAISMIMIIILVITPIPHIYPSHIFRCVL